MKNNNKKNKNKQKLNQPDKSKFVNDENLENSINPNNKSETTNEIKKVNNANTGLIHQVRKNLIVVEDKNLTSDGNFTNRSQLTSKGLYFVDNTKDRRAGPLLQSKFEGTDKQFLPVYSLKQIELKNKHALELLEKLNKNITKYNELPAIKRWQLDISTMEKLIAHPDTELYSNVMGQGREPIFLVLNRGLGNYTFPNHIGTFERNEMYNYNVYITNYILSREQMKNFDASKNSSIIYQDLFGNSHLNIGPIIGKRKKA